MDILDKLAIPSIEDIGGLPLDTLVSLEKDNRAHLLAYHLNANVPYFGLHGTRGTSLSNIIKEKKGTFQMATFYDKEHSVLRSLQLIDMCFYVTHYAKPANDPGGILVFHLEDEGKNVSYPWEMLKGLGLFCYNMCDDEKGFDAQAMKETKDAQLWRTYMDFSPGLFKKHNAGVIRITDERVKLYNNDFVCECSYERMARSLLANRFLAEDVLLQAYRLLE